MSSAFFQIHFLIQVILYSPKSETFLYIFMDFSVRFCKQKLRRSKESLTVSKMYKESLIVSKMYVAISSDSIT